MGSFINSTLNISLVLICITIFLYQSIHSLLAFINQRPLNSRSLEKQSLYPLPAICVQPMTLDGNNLAVHNITQHGYGRQGQWRSVLPEFDDEETYQNISASFEDLVEQIEVKRDRDDYSDQYERVVLGSIQKLCNSFLATCKDLDCNTYPNKTLELLRLKDNDFVFTILISLYV